MSRAFPPRGDCPEVPDSEQIFLDLQIACSPLPIPKPFCEAPATPAPIPVLPYGCVMPEATGTFTMVASDQQPKIDISFDTSSGDNCDAPMNFDIEFPLWNCWGVKTTPAVVTLGGDPGFSLECEQPERPDGTTECQDPLCVPMLNLPCPDERYKVNVTNLPGSQGSFTIKTVPGKDCYEWGTEIDVNFPVVDIGDIGICGLQTRVKSTTTQKDSQGQTVVVNLNNVHMKALPASSAGFSTGTVTITVTPPLPNENVVVNPGQMWSYGDQLYKTTATTTAKYPPTTAGQVPIIGDKFSVQVVGAGPLNTATLKPPVNAQLGWPGGRPSWAAAATAGTFTNGDGNTIPASDCEWLLDLQIEFPPISVSASVDIYNKIRTGYKNNRKNSAGAGGGGGGGGSGGGGGAPAGSGIGDDNQCTDLKFRVWQKFKPSTNEKRPKPDYSFPDFRSIYALDTEKESDRLIQPMEPTFNRTSLMQVNVCRSVEKTEVAAGGGGEDCVMKLDTRLVPPCTSFRMYSRKLPEDSSSLSMAAGKPFSAEDRFEQETGLNGVKPPPKTWQENPIAWDNQQLGIGGCNEFLPADIGIPTEFGLADNGVFIAAPMDDVNTRLQQFSDEFKFTDFDPIEKPGPEGSKLMFNGMPAVRLIKESGTGKDVFYPEDKTLETFHDESYTTAPKIELTGGLYLTASKEGLVDNRCQIDVRSDIELKIPAGDTKVVDYVYDFYVEPETGKIFVKKNLMTVFDGIVSAVITEELYEGAKGGMYRNMLKMANGGQEYPVTSDDEELDKFKFNRELPTIPCEAGGSAPGGG